jgi:hypothetical protein
MQDHALKVALAAQNRGEPSHTIRPQFELLILLSKCSTSVHNSRIRTVDSSAVRTYGGNC